MSEVKFTPGLIAAAPELLKALMKSKNIIEFMLANVGDAAPIEYRSVLKEIESAIKKANS